MFSGLFYSRPQSKNGSKSRNSATGTKIESAEREQSSEREELVSARVFSGGSTKESIQNRNKENSGSIMCVLCCCEPHAYHISENILRHYTINLPYFDSVDPHYFM